MAKKISQLTQATQVKSDDVTVIVQDGETKKLPLNMMVTKQDIENKKVTGLAKLDEIEATYENDTYTPTITVKNKSSVKVGEGDGVDYSANVMDGPAKSAILKGQTLVNTWNKHETHNKSNFILHDDGFMELKPNVLYLDHIQKSTSCLKPNTKYLLIVEVKDNTLPNDIYVQPDSRTYFYNNERVILYPPKTNGVTKTLLTTIPDFSTTRGDLQWGVYIQHDQSNVDESKRGTVKIRQMLIEYQDGMENWDIPYFESMQSVKMPVLTTTGKNLFDGTVVKSSVNVTTGEIFPNESSEWFATDYIDVKDIKSLYFQTGYMSNLNVVYMCFDSNKKFIGYKGFYNSLTGVINPLENTHYIRLRLHSTIDLSTTQIEQGTQATSYEPFKSNILTTPSDLELRGIGDVQDTLDLNTGKVIENLIEVSINSETKIEGYSQTIGSHSNTSRFMIHIKDTFGVDVENGYGLSDKIPYMQNDNDVFHFKIGDAKNSCFIYVPISELKSNDWNGFVEWAKNKNFKILLKRSEKSIKTVDLIPSGTHPSTTPYCWKDGHIQLSSSGLLPSLEYSVVTSRAGQISQNAAMIVKNDKRIFDLEILLAGGLVNTTYQALTLQNQVETGLSKVSLSSEKEPDYLLYHMIMKLIEEKAYKLDDLAEKVSVFYLYEKLSDEQFEAIYAALYPFVEDEYDELPEEAENEVVM